MGRLKFQFHCNRDTRDIIEAETEKNFFNMSNLVQNPAKFQFNCIIEILEIE